MKKGTNSFQSFSNYSKNLIENKSPPPQTSHFFFSINTTWSRSIHPRIPRRLFPEASKTNLVHYEILQAREEKAPEAVPDASFRRSGSGLLGGGGREERARRAPDRPSSPSATLKTETRSTLQPFHLPPPPHVFPSPLRLWIEERTTLRQEFGLQFLQPWRLLGPRGIVTRPGRPGPPPPSLPRVLRHHYLKLKLVPRVHPRGPRRGGNRWKLLGACYWRGGGGWIFVSLSLSLSSVWNTRMETLVGFSMELNKRLEDGFGLWILGGRVRLILRVDYRGWEISNVSKRR